MTRIVCFILGLVFLGLGFLGITNFVPMLSNELIYLNIGEIALGIIGMLFGVYSKQGSENTRLRKSNKQFTKESSDQLIKQNEQLKKEIEQLRIEKKVV